MKTAKMAEITSFVDASIFVYRGVTVHRNPPETTKHGLKPMKTAKMAEVTSFSDASIVVYRGVTVHRNPPKTTNRGL